MLSGNTPLPPRRLCVAVVGCAGKVWWLSFLLLPASRATRSDRFVTLEIALWCPRVVRPVRRPLSSGETCCYVGAMKKSEYPVIDS